VNIRDFLDVRVICETGSLRKAATVLGVTQPTLSNRIAHLEDQLGASLFDRSRGQSQPTDLALFIARRAATMADEASRLAEEAKRLASGRGGLVRIGVSPVPSRIMFPDIVISIADQFPNISLDVLSAPTSKLAEGLIERQLDMIVCPALDCSHTEIASEVLLETDIIVVARPGHPLCTDRRLRSQGCSSTRLPCQSPRSTTSTRSSATTGSTSRTCRAGSCAPIQACSPHRPEERAAVHRGTAVLFLARNRRRPAAHRRHARADGTHPPPALEPDALPLPAVRRAQDAIRKAFASL